MGIALPSGPCLADHAANGLESAEADHLGAGAGRDGCSALAEGTLAGGNNARLLNVRILFKDESEISERPSIRRTWAPCGQTPVLTHVLGWKYLLVASVLANRWDGQRIRLYFQIRPGAYNKESFMEFLRGIDKHFPGQNRILIWDRLPAHRSGPVVEYLSTRSLWCSIE